MRNPGMNIADRYRAGQSVRQIAHETGWEQTTVWRDLKAAGVEMRPSTGTQAHTRQRIAELRAHGPLRRGDCSRFARQWGLTRPAVVYVVRRYVPELEAWHD